MTDSEYSELVEFLDRRFERIDERFDQVDERFEQVDERFDRIDERLRRVEVFSEENRSLIQTVAEGVSNVDRKLETFRSEVDLRFRELRDLLQASHGELDRRVTTLERSRDRPDRGD